MKAQETQAARELQETADVTPHKLISLLMAGLLERVDQAKTCLASGDKEAEDLLLSKVIAIINGLRDCLNFDHGGDIAINLDKLYTYMIERLDDASDMQGKTDALTEIETLVAEVKSGWDGVDEDVAA